MDNALDKQTVHPPGKNLFCDFPSAFVRPKNLRRNHPPKES
jgi:hypothetical protein